MQSLLLFLLFGNVIATKKILVEHLDLYISKSLYISLKYLNYITIFKTSIYTGSTRRRRKRNKYGKCDEWSSCSAKNEFEFFSYCTLRGWSFAIWVPDPPVARPTTSRNVANCRCIAATKSHKRAIWGIMGWSRICIRYCLHCIRPEWNVQRLILFCGYLPDTWVFLVLWMMQLLSVTFLHWCGWEQWCHNTNTKLRTVTNVNRRWSHKIRIHVVPETWFYIHASQRLDCGYCVITCSAPTPTTSVLRHQWPMAPWQHSGERRPWHQWRAPSTPTTSAPSTPVTSTPSTPVTSAPSTPTTGASSTPTTESSNQTSSPPSQSSSSSGSDDDTTVIAVVVSVVGVFVVGGIASYFMCRRKV